MWTESRLIVLSKEPGKYVIEGIASASKNAQMLHVISRIPRMVQLLQEIVSLHEDGDWENEEACLEDIEAFLDELGEIEDDS